jgi:hypothetical protein
MGAVNVVKPKVKSRNREKMRATNKIAVNHLLKMGFTDITLRTHCRHKDFVYNKDKNYRATDYYNLFDGMGFDQKGDLIFLQFKTNAFPAAGPIISFCTRYSQKAIAINVKTHIKGKPIILLREYDKNKT